MHAHTRLAPAQVFLHCHGQPQLFHNDSRGFEALWRTGAPDCTTYMAGINILTSHAHTQFVQQFLVSDSLSASWPLAKHTGLPMTFCLMCHPYFLPKGSAISCVTSVYIFSVSVSKLVTLMLVPLDVCSL
jgi:hypothetical protein